MLAYNLSDRREGKLAEEDQVAGVLGDQRHEVKERQAHKAVVIFLKHHGEEKVERGGVVVKALWLSASEHSQEKVLVSCSTVPDKGQEIVGRPLELGDVKRGCQEGVTPGVAPHSLGPLLTCALANSPLRQDRAQSGSLCPPL